MHAIAVKNGRTWITDYVSILIAAAISLVFLLIVWSQQNESPLLITNSHSTIFSAKYARDDWGGDGSSGPGSSPFNTLAYRKLLQKIFNDDQRFNSIVDLGCGDWQIMKFIQIPLAKTYRGIDVVPGVIENNRRLYESKNIKFSLINHLNDLNVNSPGSELLQGVDLLIVKEVLIHLSNAEIQYFIDNILPNVKFALITNGFSNDAQDLMNQDIATGSFRPVDLTYPPFNLMNGTMELILRYTYNYDNYNVPMRVYLYTNPAELDRGRQWHNFTLN